MSSVTATINVNINAANAAAQLAGLQSKVATMNKGMLAATAGGVMAQEKAIKRMGNVLSGSGMFTTGIRNVHTQLGRMHQEFDKGSTTMSKYRQNSKMWSNDHSRINALAADRVRMLQSQYVALGKEMNGVQKAMQIKPDRMMREFGADAMYATQQQMLFRRNLQMGATSLVNWGKNTQWAGRQMMVGMGIPIAIVSAGAIKSFNEIEQASIAFKRVYGDTTTSVAEKSKMLTTVQKGVAKEMMKYGIATADTLDVAAKAAATGAQGADLIAATRETMRLATLGNMDYQKALESTIAMQTAFGISAEDMGQKTDFLNAVENQTILSMEDMALAVPRVAPVIKGLGGGIEELAIMMTALRQGGVTAEQGANALKSGLASMINPTSTATEALGNMGINLDKIVKANKGDIIGTVQGLGKALEGLSKFKRQQALESLFGKYQYARMGALLKNINSKAVKETMKMAKAAPEELAKMSAQELSQISDSPMIKLRKSIEELKAAAAPLGAVLSDIGAKVIGFVTPMVEFFSNNSWARGFLIGVAGIAAAAGTLTMIVGVLANFVGSMIKAAMAVKNFFRIITGRGSLAYVASEELEAAAAANSLASASERAASAHMAQANAAKLLVSELNALAAAQLKTAGTTSAVGTRPVTTAPAPKTTQPLVSAYPQDAAYFKSGYDRAHAARPITMTSTDPMYQAWKKKWEGYYTAKRYPEGIPDNERTRILRDMQAGKQITGYNAEAFLMRSDLNREMDTTRLGASTRDVVADARALGGRTVSTYFDNLARGMGLTTEEAQQQFHSREDIRQIAGRLTTGYINALSSVTEENITGELYQQVTAPPLEQAKRELRALSPDIAAAVDKLERPGFVSSPSQKDRVPMPTTVNDTVVWGKGKDGDLGKVVGNTGFHDVPLFVADKDGNITGTVVPDSSPAGKATKATAAAAKKVSAGKVSMPTGMGPVYTQSQLERSAQATRPAQQAREALDNKGPTKPSFRDRYRSNKESSMLRGRMPGMGLMGVGMLASTVTMGMEMAGKEIPNAVNFAVNGLTGIGMASMFFPGAMTKVSSGLKAMSSGVTGLVPMLGATGPIGMAVAAVAAVSAGLLLYGKSQVDHLKDQTIKLAKTYSATSEVVEAYADEVGKESRSHREARIAASLATKETISLSESQKAEAKLASESGRVMLQNVKDAFAGGGIQSAITSITGQIGTLMSEGLIGRKGAKNLAVTMGQAIGLNEQQQVQLLGVLDKITGPGIDNPLEVKVKVQKQGFEQSIRDAINGYEQKGWWGKFASSLASTSPTEDAAGAAMAQQGLQTNVSGSGYNQLIAAMRDSGLKTGQAIAAYSREIDKQFKGASMGYNKQDVSSLQSFADGIGVNAPARMGAIRIKAMIAQGDISPEAFDKLFEGTDKDLQRNMLINIGGANTKSEEMISAIMTKGGGEADSLRNWLSTEGVDASKVNAMGNAYEKLGSAASRFNIDFTKTTPKMLESMKPVAKQIENMPISMQKAIQIDPSTINAPKAYAKNLQYVRTAAQVANTSLKGLGLDKKTLNDPKELNKAIKGMKGSKVDLKVRAKLDQKDLKPKGKVDVPTKWKQPDGKIKPPSGKVGVPTKWQQPDGKIKKPDRQTVPVKYGQPQNVIKKPEVAVQKVNREVGVENLPDPNNSKQAVDRHLGLRPELVAPPPVSQTVNRKVVGATGGMFANGGIHKGDGKVRGEGGPTDDKVNARLSNGEFVIRAKSVSKYGTAFLDAVNRGAYEKQAHAKGTKPVPGATLPPKESDAKGRQADFNKDWKQMMWEMENFLNEVKAMPKIIKQGTQMLPKKMREFGDEFARYLMETYDPKQINKILNKTKKGKFTAQGKKVSRQWVQEQKITEKFDKKQALREEIESQKASLKAAKARDQLLRSRDAYGKETPEATAIGNMSDEQMQMYQGFKTQKKKNAFVKRLVGVEQINKAQADYAEKFSRRKEVEKQYGSATGKDIAGLTGSGFNLEQLSQWANDLGMSIQDLAEQFADGNLPTNIDQLAAQAKQAGKALEVLAMTKTERQSEQISNYEQKMANLQKQAEAKGRANVIGKNLGGQIGSGNSQGELEAQMALVDAQNAIKQAQIDDINEKYDKQLETIDLINQHQQAIANLERGRLTVAGALSTGDIAAAAAAAQEHRNNMASFAQDQMRRQLENQQKAQTQVLQDQINEAAKLNRDIQNQITLAIAEANVEQAAAIAAEQAKADDIVLNTTYIADMNAELDNQNALLAAELTTLQNMVTAAQALQAALSNQPPPPAEYSVPSNSTGTGGGGTVGGGGGFAKKAKNNKSKKNKAFGGYIPGIGNIDSVNTMLTPGEFVVNKAQAAKFGPTLRDINAGSFKGGAINGGNVNIDNIIFQINGTNLNERDIADIAVRRIQTLDAATIRGGRF